MGHVFCGCLLIPLTLAAVLYNPETYNFGGNWQKYIRELSCSSRDDLQLSLGISRFHLVRFLSPDDEGGHSDDDRPVLQNLSFIDIGCGSGIHSAAALFSHARHIISFDQQEGSVSSTAALRHQLMENDNSFSDRSWDVYLGDVLIQSDLPEVLADVVYSWGALHHTRDLWTALENSCRLVKPPEDGGGLLLVALYAREMVRDPDYWIYIKQLYLAVDDLARGKMERDYGWWILREQVMQKGRNPFQMAEDARLQRGMNFWTDVKDWLDWLGGYPIEFSEAAEVIRFVQQRCGLVPVKVEPSTVTEFLFVTDPKRFAPAQLEKRSKLLKEWHEELLNQSRMVLLDGPFFQLDYPRRTKCYIADLPVKAEEMSSLRVDVLEDGVFYGFGLDTGIPVDAEGKRKLTSLFKDFAEEDYNAANPSREWQGRFGADGLTCNHPGRHFREVFWLESALDAPAVIFSSSDGSDPNKNGRKYSILVQKGTGIPSKEKKNRPIAADIDWSRY